MKRKCIPIVVIAAFLLSACAGSKNNSPDNGDSPAQTIPDAETPSESAIEVSADDNSIEPSAPEDSSLDISAEEETDNEDIKEEEESSSAGTEGYKQAYINLIMSEANSVLEFTADTSSEDYAESIDCYWIYDIDKDGTPELLIRYGSCEADFHGKLYTYEDGAAKFIDELYMGHVSYCADPDENGILSYWGHMGYAECSRLSLIDGKLSSETLYSEDINEKLQNDEDAWYKDSNEIVDGAYFLKDFSYENVYPIEVYEAMEENSKKDSKTASDSYSFPDDDPDFYTKIMDGNTPVNAVAADEFMNNPGNVPFNRLVEADVIYPYAHDGLEIRDIEYSDLNADGIYECAFNFVEKGSSPGSYGSRYRGIISRQGGELYVYLTFSPQETSVTEDGYFITDVGEYVEERSIERFMYDKEKCFAFAVSPDAR